MLKMPNQEVLEQQHMSCRDWDLTLMVVWVATWLKFSCLGLILPGRYLCNSVWWLPWHFLQRWTDLHCRAKWPNRRQLIQRLCALRTDSLPSWGNSLNLLQLNSGCLSDLHSTHTWDSEISVLVANDVTGLLVRKFLLISSFENFLHSGVDVSDACA